MGTVLFTIPVYPCGPEKFESEWNKYLLRLIDDCSEPDTMLPMLRKSMEPASVWKLNRVIGYIVIEVTRNDIVAEVYKMDRQQLGPIRMSKGTIRNLMPSGNHFRHIGMSNEEIATATRQLVKDMKNIFFKGKYADLEGFLVSASFVDYRSLASVSADH